MTDYPYRTLCSHFLFYVYEIPGSADHRGLLKVRDMSFKSAKKVSDNHQAMRVLV